MCNKMYTKYSEAIDISKREDTKFVIELKRKRKLVAAQVKARAAQNPLHYHNTRLAYSSTHKKELNQTKLRHYHEHKEVADQRLKDWRRGHPEWRESNRKKAKERWEILTGLAALGLGKSPAQLQRENRLAKQIQVRRLSNVPKPIIVVEKYCR